MRTTPSPAIKIAQPRGATRARILTESLALFNARGPGAVTTAEIAAASDISEGNLHYHFRRKDQIIEALFDAYEQALDATIAHSAALFAQDSNHDLQIGPFFSTLWAWRFIYASHVTRAAPHLAPRLVRISERGQNQVKSVLHQLVARGQLQATPAQIDLLVVNAWVVACYWMEYLQSRQGIIEITPDHWNQGLAQVEALFAPYWHPERGAWTT